MLQVRVDAAAPTPPVDAASSIFSFSPAGTSFAAPVTVSFPLPAAVTNPEIYWTSSPNPPVYETVASRVVGDRIEADISHFSHGFVGMPSIVDAGLPDSGQSDVGTAADTGTSPDSGPAASFGVTTASLPVADACADRQVSLTASRSGPLQWRLSSLTELFALNPSTPPIGQASIDAATGMLTLEPEPLLQGAVRAVGVEVTDPADGATAQRAWSYVVDSISTYEVANGGPTIFTAGPTLPNLSQSNPSGYTPTVAVGHSGHPCSLIYDYSRNCSPGTHAEPFLQIFPASGAMTVVTAIDIFGPGSYCLDTHAQVRVEGQRYTLDRRQFQFTMVP